MNESRSERTRRLIRISVGVLREDRRLFVFPAVSAAISIGIGGLCFALSTATVGGHGHTRRVLLIAGILASYPVTFATLFCGVALAAMLARRLNGEGVSRSDAWRAARERIGVIAGWTLLVCTVGAVLRTLEQYLPLGGKIVAWIADISWSLATLLAVPVLAYEELGPLETMRRSVSLFRKRWAEQTMGTVGIGVAFGVVSVPFILLVVAGVAMSNGTGVILAAIGGAGFLGVTAVQIAVDQVFRVFVYRNALGLDTGEDGPFPREDLERPFTPRRGLFGTT